MDVQLPTRSITLAEPDTNQLKHMAPQLQDFPDELLVEVLGYLPKSDLKSARLTCTRYASIGAQWLFQRVYFAPRKAAMDTFLNISANPTFARTVTELVYDGRLFVPELAAYKPFKEAFDGYIRASYDSDFMNSEERFNAFIWDQYSEDEGNIANAAASEWQEARLKGYDAFLANCLVRYARLVDQQQSILVEKKDYEALSAGLKKFPSISKTTILDNPGYDSRYYQRCSREIAVPIQPSMWPYPRKWDVRGIHNLIGALSEHCQSLEQLHIGSRFWSAPMIIFEMDEDAVNDACTVAKRLTHLKMSLHMPTSDSIGDIEKQYDCISKSLSAAKELRCLAMTGRLDSEFLQDMFWPHLEKLDLEDLGLDAMELKAITQTHKGTLRELTLANVNLWGEEGWVDAAREIGKYLRLHRVNFFEVCDELTRERTGVPYLEDETSLAVARSFMQSIPRTILSGTEGDRTITACPEKDSSLVEVGDSHNS